MHTKVDITAWKLLDCHLLQAEVPNPKGTSAWKTLKGNQVYKVDMFA